MTMTAERPHLSRSGAAHRREVLAAARRELPPDFGERQVHNDEEAQMRLEEIKKKVDNDEGLDIQSRAKLILEQYWLEFRLKKINQAERDSRVDRLLNSLEPELRKWFVTQDEQDKNRFSPLALIRERVMPSGRVEGYFTKRGRGY